MSDSPNENNVKHESVSSSELDSLFEKHNIAQSLSSLSQVIVHIDQHPIHEQFCCKIDAITYRHPDTGDDVITYYEYERAKDHSKYRVILRLRVENTAYHRSFGS
jgi:hypothetical protein